MLTYYTSTAFDPPNGNAWSLTPTFAAQLRQPNSCRNCWTWSLKISLQRQRRHRSENQNCSWEELWCYVFFFLVAICAIWALQFRDFLEGVEASFCWCNNVTSCCWNSPIEKGEPGPGSSRFRLEAWVMFRNKVKQVCCSLKKYLDCGQ